MPTDPDAPPSCADCGRDATDQHDDPSRQWGVVWLCELCAATREEDDRD